MKKQLFLLILISLLTSACKKYDFLYDNIDGQISDLNQSFSALSTSGACTISKCPEDLPTTLCNLITKEADKNSDILFLVDKTTSMSDDIDNVKKGLNDIIDCLPSNNIRLGCALYADNIDDPMNGIEWYESTPFTSDFNIIRTYVNNISVEGGGYSIPESVYDALYRAMEEYNWSSEKGNKMIILIGDAPPLEKPDTKYTREDVLKLAKDLGIGLNIYPVLITNEGC